MWESNLSNIWTISLQFYKVNWKAKLIFFSRTCDHTWIASNRTYTFKFQFVLYDLNAFLCVILVIHIAWCLLNNEMRGVRGVLRSERERERDFALLKDPMGKKKEAENEQWMIHSFLLIVKSNQSLSLFRVTSFEKNRLKVDSSNTK